MTLSSMIRKRRPVAVATAIPAIPATQQVEVVGTVARIATIAVANHLGGQTEKAANVHLLTTSRCWRIYYRDGDPVEMACFRDVTRAEILETYSDAVRAEPFEPIRQQPTTAMTANEEITLVLEKYNLD